MRRKCLIRPQEHIYKYIHTHTKDSDRNNGLHFGHLCCQWCAFCACEQLAFVCSVFVWIHCDSQWRVRIPYHSDQMNQIPTTFNVVQTKMLDSYISVGIEMNISFRHRIKTKTYWTIVRTIVRLNGMPYYSILIRWTGTSADDFDDHAITLKLDHLIFSVWFNVQYVR